MAELDKLIEKMVQDNVQRAVLVNDQPMRLFTAQGQLTGSAISKARLQSILQEILPPNLYAQLSQDGSFHFPYHSPYGVFDINAASILGTVQATISPVGATAAVPTSNQYFPQPSQPQAQAKPKLNRTVANTHSSVQLGSWSLRRFRRLFRHGGSARSPSFSQWHKITRARSW